MKIGPAGKTSDDTDWDVHQQTLFVCAALRRLKVRIAFVRMQLHF
jgi:hypothetical protein